VKRDIYRAMGGRPAWRNRGGSAPGAGRSPRPTNGEPGIFRESETCGTGHCCGSPPLPIAHIEPFKFAQTNMFRATLATREILSSGWFSCKDRGIDPATTLIRDSFDGPV